MHRVGDIDTTVDVPLRLPSPPSPYRPPAISCKGLFSRGRSELIETLEIGSEVVPSNRVSVIEIAKNSIQNIIIIPKSWWTDNISDINDDSPQPRRCSAQGHPYVVLGILNDEGEIVREVIMEVPRSESLFTTLRSGIRNLRPLSRRVLSFKKVAGFGVYRCSIAEPLDLQNALILDSRTAAALSRLWKDCRRKTPDYDDRWLQWIQHSFNNDSTLPEDGQYGVSLKLKWSASQFVYYGSLGIGMSFLAGFGISFGWKTDEMKYQDYIGLYQTAWTIAGYIVTVFGGLYSTIGHM
jgi:hypothetical protein